MTTAQVAWWREPTRGQWISFGAAWAGWVMDAFDFTIFLLVMPQIAKEFGVSMTATAWSITLTLLLRLLGGVAAGAAADRWGRKLPLMLSVIWFAACDGAVAFAPSFGWVIALRTLFGFGMGAEWTSGATLAMENWPTRSRGIASGVLQGSWAVGFLLAGVVAAYVTPVWGWRGLFVIAAIPAILVLPIRIWVPESPDWKKEVEARKAAEKKAAPVTALVKSEMITKLVWASLVMALGFGAYYALIGLYPTMLETELGQSPGQRAYFVAMFNIGMMAGAIACGILASRRGFIYAVAIPALLALPVLPFYVGYAPNMLALGALLGGAFGAGFSGVTPLLLTSLFPAHIRARAVGFVYHIGAFAAAFVPTGVAALAEYTRLSLAQSIAIVAGVCELTLAVAMFLRPSAVTRASQSAQLSEATEGAEAAPPVHT